MDLQIFALLAQDGLTNGAIYALLALALVLVFAVTRVIFLPQGEFLAWGALTMAALEAGNFPTTVWILLGFGIVTFVMDLLGVGGVGRKKLGRSGLLNIVYPLALAALLSFLPLSNLPAVLKVLLTLAVVVPVGPMVYRVVFQPVAEASVLVLLIASVALHLLMVGLGLLAFGPEGSRTAPFSDAQFEFGSMMIGGHTLVVIMVSLVLIIGLYLFFSRTVTGKALRATAINRNGARLMGISPSLAGRQTFFLAALIGALSGLLVAPLTTIYYDSGFLMGLKGFVAAIIGGLASYPLAALGAVLVGLLESFSSFWMSAFKDVLVFALIIPVLIWLSWAVKHVEEEDVAAGDGAASGPRRNGWINPRWGLAVFLACLALAPLALPEFYVTLLNYIGLSALVALGLVLLTGVGGLTSFGQAAFVGIGAYATAWLTTSQEIPSWLAFASGSAWLALLVGLALSALVALVLGSVTLRLSGHYLPLGTMAWGISLYFLFGNMESLGGHAGISSFNLWLCADRESPLLLPDLGDCPRGALHHRESARLPRGAGHQGAEGRHGDGRIDGRRHLTLPHGHLPDRRAACEHRRLALRAPAKVRESDALRPANRHGIPVHGGYWRCRAGLGRGGRLGGDHATQAMATGTSSAALRFGWAI